MRPNGDMGITSKIYEKKINSICAFAINDDYQNRRI